MIYKKKGIIISLALILLLAAGTVFVLKMNNGNDNGDTDLQAADAYTIVSENTEDLAEITVEAQGFHIKASNSGDFGWTINDLSREDISSEKVYELVFALSNLVSGEKYDAHGDISEYGFDNPTATVIIKKHDNSEIKLTIGDKSPTAGEYFIMREGDENIYAISEYKVETILQPVSYYTEFDRLEFNIADVTRILIERGNEKIELKVKDDIDKFSGVVWEMISPFHGNSNDDYIDDKILGQIEEMDLSLPVEDPDNAFDKNAVSVTLTIAPYDDVTGKYGEEYTEKVLIGRTEGEKTYIKHKNKVYLTSSESVEFAHSSAFNMVSKMQALVNIAYVSSVTVEYNGKTHRMDISRDDSNRYSFKLDGRDVDRNSAQSAYENIISLAVDAVYDGTPASDTVLKITYEGTENTVVEIKKIDNINCVLIRNGQAGFTIRSSKIKEFTKMFDSYVETSDK